MHSQVRKSACMAYIAFPTKEWDNENAISQCCANLMQLYNRFNSRAADSDDAIQ